MTQQNGNPAYLRDLTDLLGRDGLRSFGRPGPGDGSPSLQARVSQAFRAQLVSCFLAEPGPEDVQSGGLH